MAINTVDKMEKRASSAKPAPRQPSIENAPEVRVIYVPGLVIPIFTGKAFIDNWYYLFEKGAEFVQRDLGRSEMAARALMEESMRMNNLIRGMATEDILRDPRAIDLVTEDAEKSRKIPSVILVRHEDAPIGDYFAISVQRTFFVKSDPPDSEVKTLPIPTMYHGLRAVDEEERRFRTPEEEAVVKRLRVGRLLTDYALLTHRGVRRYVHRTANAVAVWANMNARGLIQADRHPWDKLFDEDPREYAIAKEVAHLLGAHGSEIEPTGVSRGATPEPNRTLRIEDHPVVTKLHRKITSSPPKGFGADPENGDVVYGLWKVS